MYSSQLTPKSQLDWNMLCSKSTKVSGSNLIGPLGLLIYVTYGRSSFHPEILQKGRESSMRRIQKHLGLSKMTIIQMFVLPIRTLQTHVWIPNTHLTEKNDCYIDVWPAHTYCMDTCMHCLYNCMDLNNIVCMIVQIRIVLSMRPYGTKCYWKHIFPSYLLSLPLCCSTYSTAQVC